MLEYVFKKKLQRNVSEMQHKNYTISTSCGL